MTVLAEVIGWGSALLLLPTFGIQTLRQWQARHEPRRALHYGSLSSPLLVPVAR